jgi:Ser/Thr protein kinase RdoA (MazF antagonist)
MLNPIYVARAGFTGDGGQLINDIANVYSLGPILNAKVLEIGYEDCNILLETNKRKFNAKIFAKFRSPAQIERYVSIMQVAIEGGVHHPYLNRTRDGKNVFVHSSGASMVLLDFIDGLTYFDTKTIPTDKELLLIMQETVKINALPIRPEFLFDAWAVPNIHKMYGLVHKYLNVEDVNLVEFAIERYNKINISKLPTCFTHSDIYSSNVIKDNKGKIWIIDFAVANVYPRVQELSVIAAMLLHGNKYKNLQSQIKTTVDAYLSRGGKLNDYENFIIFDYSLAVLAMVIIGSYKTKYVDKFKPPEETYIFNLGRDGLKKALKNI